MLSRSQISLCVQMPPGLLSPRVESVYLSIISYYQILFDFTIKEDFAIRIMIQQYLYYGGFGFLIKYPMVHRATRAVIGKTAPYFKANSWISAINEFKEISLTDYKSKWLLLFFYPLDFTFVCPTEIVEFSNYAEAFRKHNCEVLGCSVDSHFTHRRWTMEPKNVGGLGPINIPLLADLKTEVGSAYGVMNDDGQAMRGTFLIDNQQILRHISITDLDVGRNIPEYLRLLQAFQYNAQHGQVCPAGWTKGSPSIKPKLNSSELNNYWQAVHAKK